MPDLICTLFTVFCEQFVINYAIDNPIVTFIVSSSHKVNLVYTREIRFHLNVKVFMTQLLLATFLCFVLKVNKVNSVLHIFSCSSHPISFFS